MVNNLVLEQCRKSIQAEMGTLANLPHELSNTIANFYYRMHILSLDMQNNKIPVVVAKDNNIFRGLKKYAYELEWIMAFKKPLIEAISDLQTMNKNDRMYRYMVTFYLDIYKYHIKNAAKKSGLRRMIERKFKRVNEISNLIDLIKI